MATEPKIFSKNYVSDDCVIVVNYGDGSKANAYDRDNASLWQTSGANDDDVAATYEVEFYEGDVATPRLIDSFFVVNHNLKAWTLEYWNGTAWVTLATETVDAATTTFKSFTAVTASKIRLTATATQVADAEKHVGEIIACALTLDVGSDIEGGYAPSCREQAKEVMLGDGSIHKAVSVFGQTRTQKYQAKVSFGYLSEVQRLALKAIREAGEPFLWQPESISRPSEIYLVHWANTWNEKYASTYKGAGVDVVLDLKEV